MALLPSDPKRQRQLLIGLIPVLILFGYWYFFYGKAKAQISQLQSHLDALQQKNRVAQVEMARGGPELAKKVALYVTYMHRLEELIPQRAEVPDLLHAMTLQAEQHNVTLEAMKPADEQQQQYYTREVYSLVARGPYDDVGQYLTAIGSLSRIVTPTDLSLKVAPALPNQQQQQGPGTAPDVEASFKIETFVVPAPAAPDTGTAAQHGQGG